MFIFSFVAQRPAKVHIFLYNKLSGRNGDYEWFWMTHPFILCDLAWKGQKSHAANKEGSFKFGV